MKSRDEVVQLLRGCVNENMASWFIWAHEQFPGQWLGAIHWTEKCEGYNGTSVLVHKKWCTMKGEPIEVMASIDLITYDEWSVNKDVVESHGMEVIHMLADEMRKRLATELNNLVDEMVYGEKRG